MSRIISFDKEEIIQKAMNIFWEKGYEGTSLKDLTQATGLLKGSLYNTFKSKENLFLTCLEKYGSYSRSFHYVSGDPKEYLVKFFTRLVTEGSKKENIRGCMIMNSCLELGHLDSPSAQKAKNLFQAVELNFQKVISQFDNIDAKERIYLKDNLITAAFSIREISKFRKDKRFLKQIANNVLKEFDLQI